MVTKKPAAKKVAAKKAARKVPREKLPHGRPTKYRPEYDEQAYKLCLLGATDKRMADFFEVSEQTFNTWKAQHPSFLESLNRGKDLADAEIAHALFHRAKGYSHPEEDIRTVSMGPGGSQIVITPTIKHYPPDTPAAALWLTNRQRGSWRNKQDVEHSGSDGGPIQVEAKVTMTAEEAYKRMLDGG